MKREENITYTIENIQNNKKYSTEKYERNIRVKHFEERIEEVAAEEIRSIHSRAMQKEHDDLTRGVSTSQLKKETLIGDGQTKEDEEPKYSDRSVEINRTKQSKCNENETENYCVNKEQRDIKSENCLKCDNYIETGVQCGYCQRWFHFKCEGTAKEEVMQEHLK